MKREEGLKPCPFCGSTNLEVLANVIVCEDCGAGGPTQDGPEFACNPVIRDMDWNRRPEAQTLKAERDELRQAIDSVEIENSITYDGNLWRFWSEKAKELAEKVAILEGRKQA